MSGKPTVIFKGMHFNTTLINSSASKTTSTNLKTVKTTKTKIVKRLK